MKKTDRQKNKSITQIDKYEKRKPLNSKNHNKQIKRNSVQKITLKLSSLNNDSRQNIEQQDNFKHQDLYKYKEKQKQLESLKQKDRQKYIEIINERNQKQFQNISVIAQKNEGQSFISNKHDSLDGIDQFLINVQGQQIIQTQNEQDEPSSFSSFQQDWTYLQKQYQTMNSHQIQQNQTIKSQNYFQITLQKYPHIKQVCLKQSNKRKCTFLNQLGCTNHILAGGQFDQFKNIIQTKSDLKNDKINKSLKLSYQTLNDIKNKKNNLKTKNNSQSQKINQIIFSQNQNYLQKQQHSQDLFKNFQIPSEKNLSNQIQRDYIQEEDQQYNEKQQLNPLQNYEESSQFIQGQKNMQNQPEGFIKFVNQQCYFKNRQKAKGDDSQNQIANISKIMKSQSMWRHNKSNGQQTKEKQQDQVVAMLQNQLRGKQETVEENYQQNLQSKQEIKRHQKSISTQQILKGLDEDDFQMRNFIQVIQMRQKWIESRKDRSKQWKQDQLSLLQKMKKIIKYPYVEWDQQQIKKQN